MKIKSFLLTPKVVLTVSFICLVIGFFAGMEYKKYQLRKVFDNTLDDISEVFDTGSDVVENDNWLEDVEKENTVIDKTVGDPIDFATIRVKVKSVEEVAMLSGGWGTPEVAKEGTKFVLLNVDVTNITKAPFTFDGLGVVVDDKERAFKPYFTTDIDNYFGYRVLSPDITEKGIVVYNLPKDSHSYSLLMLKAGTSEAYKIKLK